MSRKCAALEPLLPRDAPVAVLPKLERLSTGVADLDDISGHREIEEPRSVLGVEVQATVRGIGVALRPDRGVELVQEDPVGTDPGGERDAQLVTEAAAYRQTERGRIHDDRVGFVDHRVDAGRSPE